MDRTEDFLRAPRPFPGVWLRARASDQTGSWSAQRTALLPELADRRALGRLVRRTIGLQDQRCTLRTDKQIAFAGNDATYLRNVASTTSNGAGTARPKMPHISAYGGHSDSFSQVPARQERCIGP